MVGAVLLLALCGAPQGVSVKVAPVEARAGATGAEAELVRSAVRAELLAQGYRVTSGEGPTQALVVGALEREGDGWRLRLSLVNTSTQTELDDVRVSVGTRAALAAAATEATRRLATEIRVTWGVRARIKL